MLAPEKIHTVGYNIDNVTNFVGLEVGRERDHSLLLEVPRESAKASVTAIIAHGEQSQHTHSAYPRGDRLRDPFCVLWGVGDGVVNS